MTERAGIETPEPGFPYPADQDQRLNLTGECAQRTRLVAGLRDLANYLEANPHVPVPRHPEIHLHAFAGGTDAEKRAQVDHVASQLGAPVTDGTFRGGHYITEVQFGDVSYRYIAIPSDELKQRQFVRGQDVELSIVVSGAYQRSGCGTAGTVTDVEDAQGQSWYRVAVPGGRTLTLPGRMLEPIAFGTQETARGPVTTIAMAETRLVQAEAAIRCEVAHSQPPDQGDIADRDRLMHRIADICQMQPDNLMAQLEGQISREMIRQAAKPRVRSASPAASPRLRRGR